MNKHILFFIFCIICYTAQGQSSSGIMVGEKAPDIVLNNLYNYPAATAKLSDFRGKAVILDFWSSGCGSCIAAFPKMKALQDQFGQKLQIILVNPHESQQKITERMKKVPAKFKVPDLPLIAGDSLLAEYFPYKFVPHHVWIDADGYVRAITSGYNTTSKYVQKLIDGEFLDLEVKKDLINFSTIDNALISANHPSIDESLEFYSAFTRFIPGIGAGAGWKKAGGSEIYNRRYFSNASVRSLYQAAFRPTGKTGDRFDLNNRLIIEVQDPAFLNWPTDANQIDDWKSKHMYCYEIRVPADAVDQLRTYMQQDLNRYFGRIYGIVGHLETRTQKCWILTMANNQRLPTSAPLASVGNQSSHIFTNRTISSIVSSLNYNLQDVTFPIIDETGYTVPATLVLPQNLNNLEDVRSALAEYGLSLKIEERQIPMLVISSAGKDIQNREAGRRK